MQIPGVSQIGFYFLSELTPIKYYVKRKQFYLFDLRLMHATKHMNPADGISQIGLPVAIVIIGAANIKLPNIIPNSRELVLCSIILRVATENKILGTNNNPAAMRHPRLSGT
jgi:hypothetical protein